MRRLLALLPGLCLVAWIAWPVLPARPFVPRAVEFGAAIGADAGASRGDDRGWSSGVLRAPRRFDLVGLSWRDAEHVEPRIRVRDASSGRWSAWTRMGDEHGGGHGAEPVWAGGADAYQLRLRRLPHDLRARFVNATGTATAPQRALTALRREAHDALAVLRGAQAKAQDAGGRPQIVSREEWGAEQCGEPRADPSYGEVQVGFVHHTVDANDYEAQDSAAIVRAICRYHRVAKGWRDIGYNFLVDRYGQVFEGRAGGVEEPVIGAQAQGYNGLSTGVANIGTYGAVAQTPAAVRATARLLAWKLSLHGAPVRGQTTVISAGGPSNRYRAGTPVVFERISGHRDADSTACPGGALFAQLPEIRRQAAALAPVLQPAPPPATVTIGALDTTIDYPQAAQLSGRVTDAGGAALAGAAVSIQVASSAGFATLARTVSATDGTWSAQLATQYTRTLRAVARLPGGGRATSPQLGVAVAPRIGLRAPRRATARQPFQLRGSVRPLRAGLMLVIARKGSDGVFHTVARVPLRAARGTFTATVRLRRAALHRLRVESRRDARNGAGRSRDVLLRAVRSRR